MTYIRPDAVIESVVKAGVYKTGLAPRDLLIRGALSGGLLGLSASLAYTAMSQAGLAIAGAFIFPVGCAMIILLGLELVTSNFALVGAAFADRKVSAGKLAYNWSFVFIGNFAGSVIFAILFYIVVSGMGNITDSPVIKYIIAAAETKTIGYERLGAEGLMVSFVSGMLCNWLVALGVVMSFTATSTTGKIVALWLPLLTLFAQGYEHSVVNMFLIPAGIMLGAKVNIAEWWFWNEIPVVAGNIIGGAVFTGLALYITHSRNALKRAVEGKVKRLVDELEWEHSSIMGAIEKISESGLESGNAREKLSALMRSLHEHLKKEESEFYPALKKIAHDGLRESLESFLKDTEGKTGYVIKTVKRVSHSDELAKEFGNLATALKERVGKESDILNECRNLNAC